MQVRIGLLGATLAGMTVVGAYGGGQAAQTPTPAPAAQTPAPQPPPAQPQAPPAGRGQGPGRGGGQPATFPAQQRTLADAAVVERGKGLYSVSCSSCHGVDLRGGQLGGPNLLRSQVVLNDQHGELIIPIVRGSRADKGMPPQPLPDEDITAIAEFIHSVAAGAGRQGSPPPSESPLPNIVIGDAAAGQRYFAAACASCHSVTGDLQSLATRITDPRTLQNMWVSGGAVGGRGGRGPVGMPARKPVTATVTPAAGEPVQGRLVRIDHFIVTLALDDGTIRSFRRNGDVPRVEVQDPLDGHRQLLGKYTEKDIHDVTAYLVTLK